MPIPDVPVIGPQVCPDGKKQTMRNNLEAAGYHSFTLPDLLPELERNISSGNYRLIAADRKTLIWAQHLDGNVPTVIKMYRHRGLLDWQREQFSRFRVQREFDSLSFLVAKDIPCSKPLFWSFGCSSCFGYYEILATREIENITPLDQLIFNNKPEVTKPSLFASYRLVRCMHQSGCYHGAMSARNILITHNNLKKPSAYIIDMPKAILFPYDITSTRMAWMDLYLLTTKIIKYMDMNECIAVLKEYGLENASAQR